MAGNGWGWSTPAGLQAIDDPGRLLTRSRGWLAVGRVCIAHHFVEDGRTHTSASPFPTPVNLEAACRYRTEYRIPYSNSAFLRWASKPQIS